MPLTRPRRSLRRCLSLGLAVALATVAAPAFADNVKNDVSVNGGGVITTSGDQPGTTTVRYSVQATGGTCDAADGSPMNLTVAVPEGVTASPSSLVFTDCSGEADGRPVVFSSSSPGSYLIEVSASDTTGSYNVNPAKFTLQVQRGAPTNTAPQVSVGGVADGAAYEHGSVPAVVCNVTDAEDTDESATPLLGDIIGPHASLGVGSRTATCSYTDADGLTATASATYSIIDTRAPALTVPGDISVEADGPDGTVVEWEASATDAVDPAPVVGCVGGTSGDTYPLGTTTISCTATDALTNSDTAEFSINVVDRTRPTLTLPEARTVEATGPGGAEVEYDATAEDSVDGDLSADCRPPSGSLFPITTTAVECTATDAAGNSTTGSFDVTVVDTTVPELALPTDITTEATSGTGAAVDFTASAHDLVDGDVDVSCVPASGSTFALGLTTVTCTADDGAGNTGSGWFAVTVEDTTAPALTLPERVTAEAADADGAAVDFAVAADDIVDGTVPVECTAAPASLFALGVTTVDCSATDTAGNTARGSFTVEVQDTTAPTLFVPTEDVVAEATGPLGAQVGYDVSATDTVDAEVDVVCAPAPRSRFALGATEVDCTATDDHGNEATSAFTVVVQDTTGPEITVSAVQPTEAVGPDGAPVSFDAEAVDLVDGDVRVQCIPPAGSTFALGDTDVTCTAEDRRGNHSESSFTVTVQDTTAPTLTMPAEVVTEATGPDGALVGFADEVSAHDLVDLERPVTCTPGSGSQFALGETTVACQATDTRENTGNASFPVMVVDTTAPELSLPTGVTAEATGPDGAAVDFTGDVSGTDLVDGDVAPTCTPASGSAFALGETAVECEATDAAGNTATGSFAVRVQDTTAPQLTLPDDITVEATGPDGETVGWDAGAADLVDGDLPVVCTPGSGSTFVLGTTTVDCTAIDAAGNAADGSFTVTVQDTTAPTLTLPDHIRATATWSGGAEVTYETSADDLVDGAVPVACTPASGSAFTPGETTVSCTATDKAGNSATGTFVVTVSFDFRGFLRPVDADGTNHIKGGSTVPLKWQVRDADGGLISTLDIVRSIDQREVACSGAEEDGDDVPATATGGTALRYGGDQYVYNWKSARQPGSCYAVTVRLTDGSSHPAVFSLR